MTVNTHKPKISFNTSPDMRADPVPQQVHDGEATHHAVDEVDAPQLQEKIADEYHDIADRFYEGDAPETFEPMPAPRPEAETMREDEFDRAEWEKRLTAPEPEPELDPMPAPASAIEPQPKVHNSRLAALGQIAPPPPNFFARNGGLLSVAAVVGVTFFLGLGTAIWFFSDGEDGGGEQATFSAPMTEPAFAVAGVAEPVAETATRALTPDMTDVSTTVPQAVTTSPSDLTVAVLAGLQQKTVAPQHPERSNARLNREALEILSRNKIRMLREGVLAGIYRVEVYQHNGVDRVRLQTINAPLVSEYASETLLKALAGGQIEMSQSLITTDDIVDVETMMFNLVQTSLRNEHNTAGSEAALGMSRKIFAASVARTHNVNGERVYRVQAGDSLAYIALQFYGNPTAYKRILDANRSTLQSPEQIQIGQRLIIPS